MIAIEVSSKCHDVSGSSCFDCTLSKCTVDTASAQVLEHAMQVQSADHTIDQIKLFDQKIEAIVNDQAVEDPPVESTHTHPVWDMFLAQAGVSLKDRTENQIILEPKKRGRPKKHNLPVLERTITHKLSDDEAPLRSLLKSTKIKIFQDYEEYLEEGLTAREALNKVADLYKIPYIQAFNIVDDF